MAMPHERTEAILEGMVAALDFFRTGPPLTGFPSRLKTGNRACPREAPPFGISR